MDVNATFEGEFLKLMLERRTLTEEEVQEIEHAKDLERGEYKTQYNQDSGASRH